MAKAAERARDRFIADLIARQFRVEGNSFVGSVMTPVGERRIRITLPPAFPYRRPMVHPLDAQYAIQGRHQAPAENGALCLWQDEGEGSWDPEYDVDHVLARVKEWFSKSDGDGWGPENRPPDLHLSFRSQQSQLMVTGADWPPPPGDHGRFAVWEFTTVSLAAKPRPRSEFVELTSEDELPKLLLRSTPDTQPIGLWFRLASEPTPRDRFGDLLDEIQERVAESVQVSAIIRGLTGAKIREATIVVVALGYPDPLTNEERWLFVDARAEVGGWARILEAPVHSYGTAPADRRSLRRRLGAAADARGAKRVAVFGVGAIGSAVAVTLARCGIGTLDLRDGDRLRPGNVIRHAAPLLFVGRTKAWATELTVGLIAPDVKVSSAGTTWDVTEIDATIRAANLVIDAAATDAFTLLLAERCLEAERPLLVVGAQRAAQVGRLRLFRPRRDACPQCYRHPAADDVMEPEVPRLAGEERFVETGCGSTTTVASPADLEAIAVSATQVALRVLDGIDEDTNQVWVVNKAVGGGMSPLDERGIHYQAHAALQGCPLCGAA